MDMMIPQIVMEAPQASDVIPLSLPDSISDTRNNTDDRDNIKNSRTEEYGNPPIPNPSPTLRPRQANVENYREE